MVVFYDLNDINLDGEIKDFFIESVCDCYNVYGWYIVLVEDGIDLEVIYAVIEAVKVLGKLFLIEVKIVIGYGFLNK